MSYVFDEITLSKYEGRDWWETVRKVPVKILDQDFGIEVQKSDLVESTAYGILEEAEGSSSLVKEEQDSMKLLDIDNLKLRKDAVKPSYSKVTFEHDRFIVEIRSNQFGEDDFEVRIMKGFLVIYGTSKETKEGDSTVWRKFERRYMLPRDCHAFDVKSQTGDSFKDGCLTVTVFKDEPKDGRGALESSRVKNPIYSPGRRTPRSPIRNL